MNCPKCNQPIPPSQSFCGRCGTKIQQTPRQPYQGGAPVTPKNNRTPLIIAIVVISVIAVGALIAVLILALNGKDDSSDAAKSSSPVESQAESLIESLSESSAVESRVEPSENSKAEDSKKQNNSNSKPGYVIRPTDPDFISGNFGFYKLSSGELKVTEYFGTEKNVVIPSEVDGAKVTIIERHLFRKAEFESVTIPDTVNEIQDYAFAECKKLKKIAIPEGVKIIGNSAFRNCSALESVTLPTSLEKIGEYAFSASGLRSVTIPSFKKLSTLPQYMFYQCFSLSEVTLPRTIAGIDGKDNNAFDECSADLTIKAPKGSFGESLAKEKNYKFKEI